MQEGVIAAALDMETIANCRRAWDVFRDRRCDLSGDITMPTSARLLPTT